MEYNEKIVKIKDHEELTRKLRKNKKNTMNKKNIN
jgi:hypothetical protein